VTKSKVIKKENTAESSSSSSEVKTIISPSDELDEDEKSLARSNPVALFLLFTSAPAIYLVFYVLGSLEII